jgi:hypothetical protein
MRSFVVLIGVTLFVLVLGFFLAPLFMNGSHKTEHAAAAADAGLSTRTSTAPRRSLLDGPAFDPTRKPPRPAKTASAAREAQKELPPLPATANPALTGLEVEDSDSAALEAMGVPKGRTGVVIKSIDPSSSAAEAALKPGDVITRAQRDNITNTESLKRSVGDRKHTVLEIFREGHPYYVVLHKPFEGAKK